MAKVKPGNKPGMQRALRKMIKEGFDREDIQFPLCPSCVSTKK